MTMFECIRRGFGYGYGGYFGRLAAKYTSKIIQLILASLCCIAYAVLSSCGIIGN